MHPKEEILIHVLDPSRSVEGNFKAYRVVTTDDRTIIGILGATTATSVEVIDGEAKRHALSKDDIASMKETDKSLMPGGFEKVMKVERTGRPAGVPDAEGASSCRCRSTRWRPWSRTKDMFFDGRRHERAADLPGLEAEDGSSEVPFVLVDPDKGHDEERGDALRPAGERAAEDAEERERCRSAARRRRFTS